MIISELNVSDGQVTELTVRSGVVTVVLKDWQSQFYTLVFNNVVGIESYSPENVDLCHIKVLTDSDQIRKVRSVIEADEEEITEYSFISTWNDFPILSVFGEGVEIKKSNCLPSY
ncbi:hypothetical protein [Marinomonas balearica]|uniref:Uncharacterized protein n=1 Tax=Marinomonas balearica TaxID=491947 RepID=A0A4V3CGS4_9GAMM|nr:hypothetical protein [Marinomonas balearica]TDO98872.1 hypothetical protein DFP79_1285 [Marinomonas balearica]